jgi:hypothetical protein
LWLMMLISVGKTQFDGPVTHKQILESIRADLNAMGNSFGISPIEFIVSSFFSRRGLFKITDPRCAIIEKHIGKFVPDKAFLKKQYKKRAKKLKRNAAKKYIRYRRRVAAHNMESHVLLKYTQWCKKRVENHLPEVALDVYLKSRHISLRKIRAIANTPIQKKAIDDVLYRFDDRGNIIIRRGSRSQKAHFAQINKMRKDNP